MEDIVLSFLLSVLAGIIANYVSKRLDTKEKKATSLSRNPSSQKRDGKSPQEATWGDFRVHAVKVVLSFLSHSA